MAWTVLGIIAGVAVLFVVLLVVLGFWVMRNQCPARQLASARAVDIEAFLPVHRTAHVADPEQVRRLAGYLSDERKPQVRVPGPILKLTFHAGDRDKAYTIEASQLGWHWPGEFPNSRRLTDELEFCQYVESLLPEITEADLDAVPIPEEDLSWFDESKVPPELRDLIPLAKKWGVGDDLIRGELVRRASPEERAELVARVAPREDQILDYIESFGWLSAENPLPDEAARLMYLTDAMREVPVDEGEG